MEDAVPGEDSSFRSGNAVSQCERGADGRVRIRLTNGSSFFVSTEFADAKSIMPGLEISLELHRGITIESEKLEAYFKGVALLGRRDHTVVELERKLKKRGFGAESVALTLKTLQKAGYLEDRRYAEAWARNRLERRPEGYLRLAAGLRQRGVSREIITSVLDEILTEEESQKALARATAKILKNGTNDELSVLKKLTAKGFPYRRAKNHLQKLQSDGSFGLTRLS